MDQLEIKEILCAVGVDYGKGLERFMGNVALYHKFLGKFLDDKSFSQFQADFTAGDMEKAGKSVHTLKGTAGNLSLMRLYTAADETVQAAVREAVDQYEELGTNALAAVTNADTLTSAVKLCGITITYREGSVVTISETEPETSSDDTYNDTYYEQVSAYFKNVKATALSGNGLTGEGVTIAVIDSGLKFIAVDPGVFTATLVRKLIPDQVRLPAYIVIVASLVTVTELLESAAPIEYGSDYRYKKIVE